MSRIEAREASDPDVQPFTHKKEIETISVDMSSHLREATRLFNLVMYRIL